MTPGAGGERELHHDSLVALNVTHHHVLAAPHESPEGCLGDGDAHKPVGHGDDGGRPGLIGDEGKLAKVIPRAVAFYLHFAWD